MFRIWKLSRNEEDRKKKCVTKKKDAEREAYMAMDQKGWEAAENVDLCHDGRELLSITKQRAGTKRDVVGVSCL